MTETTITQFKGTDKYVATKELMSAVNVAIALQRPLLIKGEPGTGKTMLAEAIAESLGKELLIWSIKSTTKAHEGLYMYDTIQRLYDGQFGEGDVSNIKQYVKLGKLGEAFSADEQVVLLIDEIDKADLEFPNDLLWELDRMSYYIPETKETITAKHRPIVIITSNAEQELPDAFLRRCVFHYITFPEREKMQEIVRVHFPNVDATIVDKALNAFYDIRKVKSIQKQPATSELLDWIQALSLGGIDISKIESDLPHLGVLLKKDQDMASLNKQREMAKNTSSTVNSWR